MNFYFFKYVSFLFAGIPHLTLVAFWNTWWFPTGLLFIIILLIIFYSLRLSRLKVKLLEADQQALQCAEVLEYAKENERKSRENEQAVTRSKSLLIARISHEIRTPMNGILGSTDLMEQTELNDEQLEYNFNIRSSGESLLTSISNILTEDILESKHTTAGSLALDQNEFELQVAIEEVLDQFAEKAAEADVELLYEMAPDVPHYLIGDNLRLRQVMIKLLENAVQYTENGEITISVTLLQGAEDGRVNICFQVQDTGAGIPENKLEQISRNFSQPGAAEEISTGIGFGLIICKRLVGLMGGNIFIENSRPGEGTAIKFNVLTRSGAAPVSVYADNEVALFKNKKVLLVEDNAKASSILCRQLQYWQINAVTAAFGQEALDILSQPGEAFDVVVTDMLMPGINGIDLAKQVKQMHPKLAVILLNTSGNHIFHNDQMLFHAVLTKPLKKQLLRKDILHAIEQKYNVHSIKRGKSAQQLTDNFAEKYPLRILVAEDNTLNQQLMTRILNKLGYTPDIAGNGQDALEIVSEKNYDVILMDVRMPQMDGLEATRMIRLCLTVQPVIIAMTANAMEGDREECLQSGMDDYISKPISLQMLTAALEKWALFIKQR